MTNSNETFSAFLDDELTDAERNEQITESTADVNLRYRMQRYQMIGDVMRGDSKEVASLDFVSKVSAQIEQLEPLKSANQPVEEEQTERFFSRWFKPVSSLAIAASVAWVAVVSFESVMQVDDVQSVDQVATVTPQTDVSRQVERLASMPVISNVVQVSGASPVLGHVQQGQWSSRSKQSVSQAKLNAFLVNHTEHSNSMQGMIPQARVAGFDSNP
ncbi:MAG: sigma-E factor negative regulatory protein [Gammaproteobacteria bacterium]|nr:sigma-E factor negative regulatory protein [Gammaproteobacteria bacterium]